MGSAALDVYVRTFLARCVATGRARPGVLDEPGVLGLAPFGRDRRVRLLVTDDRARDLLPTLIGDARAGMITVGSAAAQCAALLAGDRTWKSGSATAMSCQHLRGVSSGGLPREPEVLPL